MCLVLLAADSHPEYSLVLAANRDEFYDRPTAPAEFWAATPSVLGGRDLKAGGSWLAIDVQGRIAAVTNYRQGQREPPAPRSRGHLVSRFLTGKFEAPKYLELVRGEGNLYNGFNLIVGDSASLCYYSNRGGEVRALGPGVYGLSNHLLDTPWPKVAAVKSGFGTLLKASDRELAGRLFDLLSDRRQAKDDELPVTGVSQEWERLLSAAFIVSGNYGTRSSTVILVGRDRRVLFIERSFGPGGKPAGEWAYELVTNSG
jgi:uncharacterized protein with NRDE domain